MIEGGIPEIEWKSDSGHGPQDIESIQIIDIYKTIDIVIGGTEMMSELCDGMVVCLAIHRMSFNGGSVSYDDLAGSLDDMDGETPSACLDHLLDPGMVDMSWKRSGDGVWRIPFSISEDAIGFVDSAYRRSTVSQGTGEV